MADSKPGPTVGPSVAEILTSHASGTGSPTATAARVADAIAARGDDGTWLSTVPREQLIAAAADIENCLSMLVVDRQRLASHDENRIRRGRGRDTVCGV